MPGQRLRQHQQQEEEEKEETEEKEEGQDVVAVCTVRTPTVEQHYVAKVGEAVPVRATLRHATY